MSAFDSLFDAARTAAMTFVATYNARCGELPKKLSKPFNDPSREFISKLHVQFK
ncbi:MAG TPA: hypothetical protein VIX58_07165 [Anaerolineae bacterium]|jgi:hypothetical protein